MPDWPARLKACRLVLAAAAPAVAALHAQAGEAMPSVPTPCPCPSPYEHDERQASAGEESASGPLGVVCGYCCERTALSRNAKYQERRFKPLLESCIAIVPEHLRRPAWLDELARSGFRGPQDAPACCQAGLAE